MKFNVKRNIPESHINNITVVGHAWGKDIEDLKP